MDLNNENIKRQVSLSQQVSTYLIEKIKNGEFLPGGLFPSETELCDSLKVSRSVIREALSRMKHDGFLESQRGSRTRVAKDTSGIAFRIDVTTQNDELFFTQMYELRAIIEPEAAAIAAQRITPEGIKTIWEKFDLLKAATASGKGATQESMDFHRSVIAASQNPIFTDLISWVENKFWSFISIYDLKHAKEMYQIIEKEHEIITKAIESRDSKKARKVSRDHIIKAAARRNIEIVLPD